MKPAAGGASRAGPATGRKPGRLPNIIRNKKKNSNLSCAVAV
jgi:hypothetical protein